METTPPVRSLTIRSDLSVLPVDRVIHERDGYMVVRAPGNPSFYFGNLLIFPDAPRSGDADRWERLFDAEFADEPGVRHRTFAWDRTDGAVGTAREEFVPRGYELDETTALTAEAADLRPHPRENRDVRIEVLDLRAPLDEGRWAEVVDVQVAGREPGYDEASYRDFSTARLRDLRRVFARYGGAWYTAIDPESDTVAGSCGLVVKEGVGRFQTVDTAEAFRRRGICSRLVVEAARDAEARFGATRFVIVADVHYHALGLYESLGFQRTEHSVAVFRRPDS